LQRFPQRPRLRRTRSDSTVEARRPTIAQRGFTLTEMIVIMVILGVLAVALLPNLTGVSVVQQRADYDKLTFALQYARKSAIARRRYACVALSASAATLTIDSNPPESTATPFGGTCHSRQRCHCLHRTAPAAAPIRPASRRSRCRPPPARSSSIRSGAPRRP
jgi:prepilin-type N-terminal cleavage/methylation domain-containing protein